MSRAEEGQNLGSPARINPDPPIKLFTEATNTGLFPCQEDGFFRRGSIQFFFCIFPTGLTLPIYLNLLEPTTDRKLTRMSRDPIDKWLDALQFENYRLQFKPNQIHAEILQSQIRELESQPVAGIAGNLLEETFHRLECLKQDLASVQQMIDLAIQLRHLRDEIREKGFLLYSPTDADEVLDGFHAWFEKTKIEQRERQWRNLASFQYYWPKADGVKRRRMVELFVTYSRRRLLWGTMNLKIVTPLKIGRWASRMYKKY